MGSHVAKANGLQVELGLQVRQGSPELERPGAVVVPLPSKLRHRTLCLGGGAHVWRCQRISSRRHVVVGRVAAALLSLGGRPCAINRKPTSDGHQRGEQRKLRRGSSAADGAAGDLTGTGSSLWPRSLRTPFLWLRPAGEQRAQHTLQRSSVSSLSSALFLTHIKTYVRNINFYVVSHSHPTLTPRVSFSFRPPPVAATPHRARCARSRARYGPMRGLLLTS